MSAYNWSSACRASAGVSSDFCPFCCSWIPVVAQGLFFAVDYSFFFLSQDLVQLQCPDYTKSFVCEAGQKMNVGTLLRPAFAGPCPCSQNSRS